MSTVAREENLVMLQNGEFWKTIRRGLVVFDMDSTLIGQEVIDEIAKFIGVEDEVSVSNVHCYSY
jgi:phosphoserine phosphatase